MPPSRSATRRSSRASHDARRLHARGRDRDHRHHAPGEAERPQPRDRGALARRARRSARRPGVDPDRDELRVLGRRRPRRAGRRCERPSTCGARSTRAWPSRRRPRSRRSRATALGGGLALAICCDLRVAQRVSATLGMPEVRRGVVAATGGTQRLPGSIGPTRAKQLLLVGDPIDAVAAERCGLVNWVVPDGTALAHARRIADRIVGASPSAVHETKRLVDNGIDLELTAALAFERASARAADRIARRRGGRTGVRRAAAATPLLGPMMDGVEIRAYAEGDYRRGRRRASPGGFPTSHGPSGLARAPGCKSSTRAVGSARRFACIPSPSSLAVDPFARPWSRR